MRNNSRWHAGLSEVLRQHTFVGMADETLALLQHSTRLYILNVANLSKDMFYQQVCLLIRLQQDLALSADCACCCRCGTVVVRCMHPRRSEGLFYLLHA